MRKMLVLFAVMACLATGCWRQTGWGADHTGFDPLEDPATAATVVSLQRTWTADVGSNATAPLAWGSSVFVTGGGAVTALNADDGTQLWRTEGVDGMGSPVSVGPLTAGDQGITAAVTAPGFGGFITFDMDTGARSGVAGFHQIAIGATAWRPDATVFVHGAYGSNAGAVVMVDYPGGQGFLGGSAGGSTSVTSPTLVGSTVLVGVNDQLLAFTMGTCPPLTPAVAGFCAPSWTASLGATVSLPVGVGSEQVAVATAAGQVAVLDVATGIEKWRTAPVSGSLAPPAVAEGLLYTGGSDGLVRGYASAGCGTSICSPLGTGTTGAGGVMHQPAVAGGFVYVGTTQGRVVAFPAGECGAASCDPTWVGLVDDGPNPGVVNSPVIAMGAVYASTEGGRLAAFH